MSHIAIKVISGNHQGKEGFIQEFADIRNGRVLVMFKGPNRNGAMVKVEDFKIVIPEAEITKPEIKEIINPRYIAFVIATNSYCKYDYAHWVQEMITAIQGTNRTIKDHEAFDKRILELLQQNSMDKKVHNFNKAEKPFPKLKRG